jgi:hypothetical protein
MTENAEMACRQGHAGFHLLGINTCTVVFAPRDFNIH